MSTTDTPEPASRAEFPFSVSITRPGRPTLYLGYRHQHEAKQAARVFTGMLRARTRPIGMTINSGATPPDVEIVPPLPTTPGDLAEHFDSSGELPAAFPHLYTRLLAQLGYSLATSIWCAACALYDKRYKPAGELGSSPIDPHDRQAVVSEAAVMLAHPAQPERTTEALAFVTDPAIRDLSGAVVADKVRALLDGGEG
ncbi:hypothetical protein NQK81_01600 [Amycolatopsis roodepoortensis]|uniref:hypothetical protein n=1 Tax=Amycolatopsis roodepoortensis TaxID=700274 RepID=UPI00214C6922|nr:hypothetical protein [Amycolatopsis roodepoortensis]UUV32170.1 hypothetical protein NQK81_01600 [Amycolatopsis roodepoortensis]